MGSVLVRTRVECAVHGADTGSETNSEYKPWIRRHQSVAPSTFVQCLCCHSDDTDAQTCVHKGLVQELPFEGWHASIFPRLPVEEGICGYDGATYDGGAVEKSLCERARARSVDLTGLLHVGAAEGRLECISRFDEGGEG